MARATMASTRLKLSWVDRTEHFMRSKALRLVILALVANTVMAQAFFNSGGRVLHLFGVDLTAFYLNLSAILSTVAFSFFEIAMLWARQEVLALDKSIQQQIGAEAWLKRNMATLIVITAINFYCLAVFNAAIWPSLTVPGIPDPPAPWRYYLHAAFYSVVLYLAGIVGERAKSEQELTMSMARRQSRQALEAHDQQVMQQIKAMTARGEPLAPLAAAISSPETAQLIALQHAVLSGQLGVLDAAHLNIAVKGQDTSLLDRLCQHVAPSVTGEKVDATTADTPADEERELVAVASNGHQAHVPGGPGRVRFTREQGARIEDWALGQEN
jgi:hypothetical protein